MAAFARMDVEGTVRLVTEDLVFVNSSSFTIHGREELRALLESVAPRIRDGAWEIRNLLSSGDTVVTERIDRLVLDGRPIELPIMGIFELRGGLIAQWRDYFDPAVSGLELE